MALKKRIPTPRPVKPKSEIEFVKCPIYRKKYELDSERKICPCCGEIHDDSCYFLKGSDLGKELVSNDSVRKRNKKKTGN